jgi:glycosyltransferase involved in cell wall biosynthesis
MKPRILFLCTACPFGTSGSGVRTFQIARQLERIGQVNMVVATAQEWTAEQRLLTEQNFNLRRVIRYQPDPIRSLGDRYRQLFDPRFLNTNGMVVPAEDRRYLDTLLEENDMVWIHTLHLANAFRRLRWPKSVIDVDDYPSRFHRSAIPHTPWLVPKLRRIRNAFAWRGRERIWDERFSILAVCKDADRAYFGATPRVHVVPNGFTAPETTAAANPAEPLLRLGMIGDFTYLPNHNGLHWFLAECWPELRRKLPEATLRLVGKSSDVIARPFQDQGVVGLGYVPDTGVEMATWRAMIVPTRLGGGTHLKVAEGLARRIPLVCTSHGTRGYSIVPGQHALVADASTDFTSACLSLLNSPAEGRRLADQGADLFRRNYSWQAIEPAVISAVEHCLKSPA